MKLRIEATPEELRTKGARLLASLSLRMREHDVALADALQKAVDPPEEDPDEEHEGEKHHIPAVEAVIRVSIARYQQQLDRMLTEVFRNLDPLHKAGPTPFVITPELLAAIRKLIELHHNVIIATTFGAGALDMASLEALKAAGMPVDLASAEDMYALGLAIAQKPEAKTWTAQQFADYVAKHPPLSPAEKAAAVSLQLHGANYIRGLGNVVDKDTGKVLIEADAKLRAKLQGQIEDAVASSIARRESLSATKSALAQATQDWTRDFDRIVRTEKHTALAQGTLDSIIASHGPSARVAILPSPDACSACKALYLGPDGHPRIFAAGALPGPSTNHGKPKSAWVPALPPLHPHCECVPARVPAGWGFGPAGALVPGGKGGVEYGDDMELQKSLINERAFRDQLRKAARRLHDRIVFRGLQISIENAIGTERPWRDGDGTRGATWMSLPYGYIRMTEGVDGDHVDVFVGGHEWAPYVYVVHTRAKNPDGTFGGYDEDKCFLGLGSADDALAAFRAHYTDPGFFGGMSTLTFDDFKAKVLATKKAPASITAVPERLLVPMQKAETPRAFDSAAMGTAMGDGPQGGLGWALAGATGLNALDAWLAPQPGQLSLHREFLEDVAESGTEPVVRDVPDTVARDGAPGLVRPLQIADRVTPDLDEAARAMEHMQRVAQHGNPPEPIRKSRRVRVVVEPA